MGLTWVMGLVMGMLLGAAAPGSDATPAVDALSGAWKLSSGENEGQPLSAAQIKGGTLVIDGPRYIISMADTGTVTGAQAVDTTRQPSTIDIIDTSGSYQGQTCLGIYELEGDEFRVVFARPGQARPTELQTEPESGQWLHVWKRIAQ